MQATRDKLPTRRCVNPRPHPELAEAVSVSRFWRNVDAREEGECWPWRGDTDQNGYGVFSYRGTMRQAHELALSFTVGELRLDSLDTCHSCDNPPCCNPTHLRFDTRKANVADMIQRGRALRGDSHPSTLLPDAHVREMRHRRANGATQKVLAEHYGISEAYVSGIVRGRQRVSAGGPIETERKYITTNPGKAG